MSLWLANFAGSTFDQSDWLKLLGIAGAAVALYLIAKRLGGGDQSYPPPMDTSSSTEIPTQQVKPPEPDRSQETEEDDSDIPAHEERPTSAGSEVHPKHFQITEWNFATFDIETGPPDPDCFADELLMTMYDKSTAHAWKHSYFVATPAGLEKILRKKKWVSMFLPQVLVMARYDVKELRAAMLDDLGTMEMQRGDVPPDDGDDAAPEQ